MQDRQLVEAVRARIDFVDLVSRYVRLRPRGKNFVGLCPFHEEKTPSFSISPDKGLFYCFGCGAKGDVFALLMKLEKLDFPEALARLASQAGVALPQRGGASPDAQLHALNEDVANAFEHNLYAPAGKAARDYLDERGVDEKTAKAFRLGYALPGWHHVQQTFGNRTQALITLGLVVRNEAGKTYDRFRDRLVFPLCNVQGQALGFAGRQLQAQADAPKYVNTPTTPLLQKGTLLYGLHLAKERASEADTLVLVEGYTDVIAAHQGGVSNVVASMGTALTADQARLCARYAKRVVLAFDPDVAGQSATLRGVQALLDEGLDVRMLHLPQGSDPDALIRDQGAEAFQKAVRSARPFFETYVDALCQRYDAYTFSGKQQVLSQALPFLKGLSNLHWRSYMVAELASSLDLPNEEIQAQLRPGRASKAPDEQSLRALQHPEEQLLYLVLQGHLSVERATSELADDNFTQYVGLWETVKTCYEKNGTLQPDVLYEHAGPRWQDTLARLSVSDMPTSDVNRTISDVVRHLKSLHFEREKRTLQRALRRAESEGNREAVKALTTQYLEHIKRRGKVMQGGGD